LFSSFSPPSAHLQERFPDQHQRETKRTYDPHRQSFQRRITIGKGSRRRRRDSDFEIWWDGEEREQSRRRRRRRRESGECELE